MIVAFGYQHGIPHFRDAKTFDVRKLTHDTNSAEFKAAQKEILEYGRKNPQQNICIGCEKGKHRSVVLARSAASALRTSLHLRDHE